MECPKCKTANAETAQFCVRCHATLLYKCPSCGSTQQHGGKCDKCGVDFAKYGAMMVAQEQIRASREHEKVRQNATTWRQIILLPVTGGYSLMKYFLRKQE